MAGYMLAVVVALWLGWAVGWAHAHFTVANECEKLGRFYVADKIFYCSRIDAAPADDQQHPPAE